MTMSVAKGSDDYRKSNSNATTRIDIETIRLHLSSFVARWQSRVSIDTLRPLPLFLGVNSAGAICFSAEAFTSPIKKLDKASPEKLKSRVAMNFAFFLSNYALVAAMVALVVALMHPGMVFFVALVYAAWACHSFLIRNELEVFGIPIHSLLTIQQRFYLLFVLTAIVVVWKCLVPSLIFVSISMILIVTHAVLRDPKHIEMMNDSDEEAENSGGDSSGSEVIVERPRKRQDVV